MLSHPSSPTSSPSLKSSKQIPHWVWLFWELLLPWGGSSSYLNCLSTKFDQITLFYLRTDFEMLFSVLWQRVLDWSLPSPTLFVGPTPPQTKKSLLSYGSPLSFSFFSKPAGAQVKNKYNIGNGIILTDINK